MDKFAVPGTKNSLKKINNQKLIKKLPDYYNCEETINGGLSFKIPIRKLAFYYFHVFIFLTASVITPLILFNTYSASSSIDDLDLGLTAVIALIAMSVICIWLSSYILFNTVEITVDKEQLTKKITPIPTLIRSAITIPASDIIQIYCQRYHLSSHGVNNNHQLRIYFISKKGKKTLLTLVATHSSDSIRAMSLLLKRTLEIEDKDKSVLEI